MCADVCSMWCVCLDEDELWWMKGKSCCWKKKTGRWVKEVDEVDKALTLDGAS